jgi:ELWxxDGT repeat protein
MDLKTLLRKALQKTEAFLFAAVKQLLLLLLLIGGVHSFGQVELVKEINTNPDPYLREYTEAIDRNGVLYFISNNELWKTNSATSETLLVKKFQQIHSLRKIEGTLYFVANDGSGLELWRSNGASYSTVRILDIMPGESGSDPRQLTIVGNSLFFTATTIANGKELWKSDGTKAGTVLVKEIMIKGGSSNPSYLTNVNGILYFAANDGINGYELWKSDGTTAGTTLVKDIRIGSRLSSAPRLLTNVNGSVYFTADDGLTGRELWKSNGTPLGTVLVKEAIPGSLGAYYNNLTNVNGTLYFSANDMVHGEELWKSDGTTTGTNMVLDLTPGKRGSGTLEPMTNFTCAKGMLYFTAYRGDVYYFCKSDGTEAGTIPFLAVGEIGINTLAARFNMLGDNLYFFNGGREGDRMLNTLMKEDAAGQISTVSTFPDADYYGALSPPFLTKSGNLLFFSARRNTSEGRSLFKTNGTPAGTQWVIDTYNPTYQSSDPDNFVKIGNTIYFTTTDIMNEAGLKVGLFKTDGTTEGTSKIIEFDAPIDIVYVKNKLYFVGHDRTLPQEWNIYTSDGTPEGTINLNLPNLVGKGRPQWLTASGDSLYYILNSKELWMTIGTTSVLLHTNAGTGPIHALGGYLYFRGYDNNSNGSELWRTNGTTAGTNLVKDINTNGPSSIAPFTSLNGILYFFANNGSHGTELWRSDGTLTGTYMVKDLRVGDTGTTTLNDMTNLIALDNALYFISSEGNETFRLWKSNGSSSGTIEVAWVPRPVVLVASNTRLYMVAYENGYQLWKSEGTPQSTMQIAELPSANFSQMNPSHAKTVNGILYSSFAGRILWRSDGTTCGTYNIEEINGSAQSLETIGDELIFGYNNTTTGRELYKINIESIPVYPCDALLAAQNMDVSVTESVNRDKISSNPNPFEDAFQLRVNGEDGSVYSMEVVDLRSIRYEMQPELQYNRAYRIGSALSPGMYLVRIREANKISVIKVIKK